MNPAMGMNHIRDTMTSTKKNILQLQTNMRISTMDYESNAFSSVKFHY